MTDEMAQLSGDSYDVALSELRASIDEAQRHAAAYVLSTYPNRDVLNTMATLARRALGSSAVEVNAIYAHHQITIGGSPHIEEPRSIADSDSLCVMTVGNNRPLAVNDLLNNTMTTSMDTSVPWRAWASAPIMINGQPAGSVCALQANEPRFWTTDDQAMLVRAAEQISEAVTSWVDAA